MNRAGKQASKQGDSSLLFKDLWIIFGSVRNRFWGYYLFTLLLLLLSLRSLIRNGFGVSSGVCRIRARLNFIEEGDGRFITTYI